MSASEIKSAAARKPVSPLFYQRPAAVTKGRHGKKRLADGGDYSFTAKANSVPLNGNEFAAAMRHYPIVFTRSDNPFSVALLGLRPDVNLMVGDDGKWDDGAYIPEYIRRFPFIFGSGPEKDQLVLCIEESSPRLNDKNGMLLYDDDGEPTELTQRALDFCGGYQERHQATVSFCTALMEHGLLVEQNAQVTLADGGKSQLHGFSVVDLEKFNRLPEETFLDWRRKGWLPLIYLHLASAGSWDALVNKAAERGEDRTRGKPAPQIVANKAIAKPGKTANKPGKTAKEKRDDKAI